MILPIAAHAQHMADSISSTLDEVVVTADAQIETGKKTILYPTKLEKRHSTNGYQLLSNMNLPELEIKANLKQITTISGQNVIILINGVEALPDELATLAAADVVSIDYQRNPGGKYAGQGAVMNFITRQYDYGGNVYLTAEQGFAHIYGNYLGMVNYKRNAVNLSVTASANWDRGRGQNSANNTFLFPQQTLYQTISSLDRRVNTESEYARFKFSHAINNHDLSVAISFNRKATPMLYIADEVKYKGLYDFNSEMIRSGDDNALSPKLDVQYNLQLPHNQTLSASLSSSFAHTRFNSVYQETDAEPIVNDTRENNLFLNAGLYYGKKLTHGISLGGTVFCLYNHYHDVYSGSYTDAQDLDNGFTQALIVLQQSFRCGVSYYANVGASVLDSRLNGNSDTHWQPTAFYGVSYAFNQRHSLSFAGLYGHTIYDPTYKNDAVIRTSFFQATIGNPDLKPFRCIQNSLTYNGRADALRINASYAFMKYLDNNIHNYFIREGIVYKQLVTDGSFTSHKINLGLTYNLLGNKLSVGANGMFAYLRLGSKTRCTEKSVWRGSVNATYFLSNWRFKIWYAPQRRTMNWDGEHIIDPTQYGLTVNWQRGNWAVECSAENLFERYQGRKISTDYGCCIMSYSNRTNSSGRNISVGVTYTLPYGRKTAKEVVEPKQGINSAILRPF